MRKLISTAFGGLPKIVLSLGAVALMVGVWSQIVSEGHSIPGADPSVEPIPVLDFSDPAKSMVVRVDFTGRTEASFADAIVSFERAHTSIGDPPLLKLDLFDDQGAPAGSFNTWHPLWAFEETAAGGEHLRILDSGEGRFVFPFDPDLGTMKLTDIPLDEEVIEVDLTGAIRDFCVANPTDPDCDIADLEMTSATVENEPPFVVIGQPEDLEVRMTFTNNGPDAPMDAELNVTAASGAGLAVTPASADVSEPALGLNEERTRDQTFSVECLAPGLHTVTFTATIDATKAAVSDPDTSNNQKQVSHSVDCAVPITINVKPRGFPNSINRQGMFDIPVAALTTAAGEYGNPLAFDATTIDPLSVRFGPAALVASGGGGQETHAAGHPEDSWELDEVTRDGDIDMVLHFSPGDSGFALSDTEGCLKGKYDGGGGTMYTFFGCDSVRIIR
jgi:hypothetical protein